MPLPVVIARMATSAGMRNIRRQMQRARKSLSKIAAKQSGAPLKETQRQISQLDKAIEKTYYNRKKGKYEHSLEELKQERHESKQYQQQLKYELKRNSVAENRRQTEMLRQYFAQGALTEAQKAGEELRTPEQILSRAQQSFFYSETKVLWQDSNIAMRNEQIVEGLKEMGATNEFGKPIENIKEAYDYIMNNRANAPTMERVLSGEFDVNETEERSGSPIPMNRAQFAEFVASLNR